MLEVKNVEVFGLDRAINAISNSYTTGEINTSYPAGISEVSRQYKVAKTLGSNIECHQSHDAYLKGIIVQFDVKYPLYWSPEFQRYHFADIIMSQSTMHSLKKMISGDIDPFNKYVTEDAKQLVTSLYRKYETCIADNEEIRKRGVLSAEESEKLKNKEYEAFMRLRSNLPCGFEMWETVTTNYLQLKTIWIQRRNHKLKEDWSAFCDFIESLPGFKELVLSKFTKELIMNKAIKKLNFND